MDSLKQFTIRSLKLNKKRTIVTIIGIILATALICAVAGMCSSIQETLVESARREEGNYHVTLKNVPANELENIEKNKCVKDYFLTENLGYDYLEESKNENKPYIYIMAFDKKALNNYGIHLIDGRLPESENEIVISNHISENGGVNLKIGDELNLNISKRKSENYELDQQSSFSEEAEEMLEKLYTKKYQIVGIIERPNRTIEPYSAPGYTAITLLNNKVENANISLLFKDANKYEENTMNINGMSKKSDKGTYEFKYNTELLRWEGAALSTSTMKTLYGISLVVIGIIIISSVLVIRNSFSISITEKMKQYGTLASIGATSKQIKKNVIFEGFVLGVIGISIGIFCRNICSVCTCTLGKLYITRFFKWN